MTSLGKLFIILFFLSCALLSYCQDEIIKYDQDHEIANVHYNNTLEGIYGGWYKSLASHPITGAFGSTGFYLHGYGKGRGQCNYIVIPTDGLLKSGQ